MQNIPYNSAQNIIKISEQSGITIPEAQALVQNSMRNVQESPLDMFVKDLSKQASSDAYKQLQGQVFKQIPKNIPIGQLLKRAGIAGLALTGKDILDAEGKATNNLVNYLKQSGHPVTSKIWDNTMLGVIGRPTNTQDYYLEPRKR